MDNSSTVAPQDAASGAAHQAEPEKNWWGVLKMLARNPYAHPVCAAAFGIVGTDMMASGMHKVVGGLLPYAPEVIAVATTGIGAMSIGLSGLSIVKDSFAIGKILKHKVEDRYVEFQASRSGPDAGITLAGVIAASIAGGRAIGRTVKEAAKSWVEPFAEGYRNSRSETVLSMDTWKIAKDGFYEVAAGGSNGEKASKNALTLFTGIAAKVTGMKAASAGTVIVILARQSTNPLTYAAACTAVGAFVAGALSASLHRARERLEKGGNSDGAIISSSFEMASILGTAGALGAAAAASRAEGTVRSAMQEVADAYDEHPAIQHILESARKYVHDAMAAGVERATAVQNFVTTHAPLLVSAHETAREGLSEAYRSAKEAAEFAKEHTVESKLMKTWLGEFAKEQAADKIVEMLREKIEEGVEHGAEIKEKPSAVVLLKRKIGAAFGKLVDLGPRAVEYIATSVPPLALTEPVPAASQARRLRSSPSSYGVGSLAARAGVPPHSAHKNLRS